MRGQYCVENLGVEQRARRRRVVICLAGLPAVGWQHRLAVVEEQQRRLIAERAFDELLGAFGFACGLAHEVGDELLADRPEHGARVAAVLQADESGARKTFGGDQPARQFGGDGGLAFAAFAANHQGAWRVLVVPAKHTLGGEQFTAAADEAVRWRRWQFAEGELLCLGDLRLHRLRRCCAYQLRVVFFLEEHRHEPVLQLQVAVEALAAAGVGV